MSTQTTDRTVAAVRRADTALARMTALLEIPRPRLIAAVLAGCATLGSAFALAAVSAWLVTTAWTMPPVLELSVAVVMVRALGISRGVFRWLERILTHHAALGGVVGLRTNLFTALAARPADQLTRLRRGDLLSRLGDDAQEMAEHVIRAVVPVIVAAVMSVAIVATIAPISLPAALAMLASLLVASVLAPWFALRAARLTEETVVSTRAEVTAGALGILDESTSLVVENRLEEALRAQRARQDAHDASIDRAAVPTAAATATVPLVMILAVGGSLLAASALWLDGTASAGQIGILLLLPLSSFEAANTLPAAASQWARSQAAARRLDQAVDGRDAAQALENARTASASAASAGTASAADAQAPSVGLTGTAPHLAARGLVAGWSPKSACIRGLDLDLPPGSRLAIVGASGLGKSTLLATLAGLLEPLDGYVTLDGADVHTLDPAQVREQISMFAEDAHVFATTVLENLRVARGDINADDAMHALEQVGLASWIASTPDGLDTMLGSDGTTISGGERRRLLLARALLRRAPITLLDEPTEHLDTAHGDALLHQLLASPDTPDASTEGGDSLFPTQSTVIVVTHRPEAVPAGTRVLRILDNGRFQFEEAS